MGFEQHCSSQVFYLKSSWNMPYLILCLRQYYRQAIEKYELDTISRPLNH